MPSVTLSPLAERDTLDIWEYICEDSVAAADRWVDQLNEKFMLWATQPMMGRARDDIEPGLRSLPFGRYVAFFEADEDGIRIIRVLHGSRDVDRLFDR